MAGIRLKMARLHADLKNRKKKDKKPYKSPNTKKTQEELKKAGLTEEERRSDVDKKPAKKAETAKKPERKTPPATKKNISSALRMAELLKKKKNKGK